MSIPATTAFLFFLVAILWFVSQMAVRHREFFETNEESLMGEGETFEDYDRIYDDFYAKVYDQLFSTPERISFEKASIQEIAMNEFSKPETKILDVCCGTAPHAKWLAEEGYEVVGVDTSESMLKKARESCPSGRFYRADVTNASTFPPKSFSHALLLYFSIYQFRNPKIVTDTIYQWLKPGGIFVVHLVDPNKFDPILAAASPFTGFSVQKYTKERVTDSEVFFGDFKYRSKFIKDRHDDNAIFEETFLFNDEQRYREHRHRMVMPSVNSMIDLVRSSGFTYKDSVDMTPIGYEYQYLVYFSK